MKRTFILIGLFLFIGSAVTPGTAQVKYDAWVTTEGSGIVIHGGKGDVPPPPPPGHYYCVHHREYHKNCKACQKAMKKYRKEMKKAHKDAIKRCKKANRGHHH